MDLAIECGSDGANKSVHASFYDSEHDQVTIVVGSGQYNWTICVFNMIEIEARFDKGWDICQKTTLHESSPNCEAATNEMDLGDHCHIFTRRADAFRMQTCSRFGQSIEYVYENCNLHQFIENSYRYGWLEDFRPVKGSILGRVASDVERVVSVLPDYKSNAIFLGGYSGTSMVLLRVPKRLEGSSTYSFVLWRKKSSPISHFPICLSEDGKTLFILNSTKVTANHISCSGLYTTCEDIAEGGWQDPLSCIWCPDKKKHVVVSSYEKTDCRHPLTKTCPPVIDHANRNENLSEWEVFGSNLDRMDDVEVYICGQKCSVNRILSSSTRLLCILSDGSVQDVACNVRVVGRLGGYEDFTLEVKKITHNVALVTDRFRYTESHSKWKDVVAILAIAILAVLGVIIYIARRKMRGLKENVTMSVLVKTIGEKTGDDYSNKFGRHLVDKFSPYEQMFRDLDERLKVDISSLHIEEEIGRGHFGIVSRATYCTPNGTTKKVACKVLKQSVAGVGDFIIEGLTMDKKFPIIVTDYMENGDLRSYLRDESKILTLRSLLRFACQIAEGMEHLHMCKSVHCDLAARNCM
ncbi:hypothetical protein RB195_024919 [Necator americanus]|uniref:Protein kinase domain-containing protein n=1 Tax=Necator americanus TaxID=51031 RepID=A0ABR1EQ93_NECAM